jgi:hypothetical protein
VEERHHGDEPTGGEEEQGPFAPIGTWCSGEEKQQLEENLDVAAALEDIDHTPLASYDVHDPIPENRHQGVVDDLAPMRLRDQQGDLGLQDTSEVIFASGHCSAEQARRAASAEGSQRNSDAQATEVETNAAVKANESEVLPVVGRRDHYDEEERHCECLPFEEAEKGRGHGGYSDDLMDLEEGSLESVADVRLPWVQAEDG